MAENKQENKTDAKELEKLKAEKAALEAQLEEERARAAAAEAQLKEKSDLLDQQVCRQEEMIAKQLRQQRKVRIVIASGRSESERSPVPIAVNGHEYLIERDKQVDVPEGVVNVLRLANEHVAQTTGGAQVNTSFHTAARFAFQILGYVNAQGELVQGCE